jgi:glycosyltransferase involved in cell wall biosynthesis
LPKALFVNVIILFFKQKKLDKNHLHQYLNMKASVIIPSYRRYLPLINTIRDLQKQYFKDFEIIIVDQNKEWPEEHNEQLKEIQKNERVTWIFLDKAEVVVARNLAVSKSQGEILIFIDDDVEIPDQDFILKHIKNYENPLINIVVGRECQPGFEFSNSIKNQTTESKQNIESLSPLQQALWFDRNSDYETKVCFFSTCNGSMRKSVFLEAYGFDENYQGNSYGDDSDLILRLYQLGYVGIYDPSTWLIHLRVPMGGLRMSDSKKKVDRARTYTGFWVFLLRHGEKKMYLHVFYNHILRRTVLLKNNLLNPWREFNVVFGLIVGFFRANNLIKKGLDSPFTKI